MARRAKSSAVTERETAPTRAVLRHWREAVPNDRMAHLVKDVWRGFMRAFQIRLAEEGVSFGHWTFLRILWEEDGLTQRELSARAGLMEPTTFSALKSMEKLGYIERSQAEENRKNVYIHLTPKGRALKKKLVPLAEEVNQIAATGVAAADLATVRRVLLTMVTNLAEEDLSADHAERRMPSTRALGRLTADEA
ncbi:MAG: hypothetical protein RLZ98_2970 [Pseudomonadota bacterium]|jgi:DNA-binding MarR family transcriptional regulator